MNWSGRALSDLERLARFLRTNDPEAAKRAIARIRSGIAILDDYPLLGRSVPGRRLDREWPIRFGDAGYIARYRMEQGKVVILAVRHMRERGFSGDP